jgi:type II secretory pathway component GspD/PulD (secretin)
MTIKRLALLTLALLPVGVTAYAQSSDAKPSDCRKLATRTDQVDCEEAHMQMRTIFLKNITAQNDANEIMVAVRNLSDPGLRIYLLNSQNALLIGTYPEQFARIEALVNAIDLPRKTYRLTYTITELDAGKTLGTEHIAMVAVDGRPTTVKQGDKIPVATGSFSTDNNSSQTQFTYLDIGLNFDATLNAVDNGAMLRTKVEQSSLGQPSTIANVTEPVVRQTVLEGNTFLTLGKPVMIGSIDVPNSTHRFDIAVVMDPIK